MNELIERIEQNVSELLKYDTKSFEEHAQELVRMMMALFPAIINVYNDPKMSDLKDDALYWPGQLERIIKVLEKGDWFEIIDALYNETMPNLIELKETLTKRGLL